MDASFLKKNALAVALLLLNGVFQPVCSEPQTECAGDVLVVGRRSTGITGSYKFMEMTWGGERLYRNELGLGSYLYFIASESSWFISPTYGLKGIRLKAKHESVDMLDSKTWSVKSTGASGLNPDPTIQVQCDDGSSKYAAFSAPAKAIYIFGRRPNSANFNMNGAYYYTNLESTGQPVYRKDSDHYISLNEVNQWIISGEDDIGSQRASAFYDAPHGNTEPVYEITGITWQITGHHGNWEQDANTKLVRGTGKPVVIGGRRGVNGAINGKYTATNNVVANRITYEKENSIIPPEMTRDVTDGATMFMYYFDHVSSAKWILSLKQDIGTGKGVAFLVDEYGDEPDGTGWQVANENSEFAEDMRVYARPER